jgi:hypothetical protein
MRPSLLRNGLAARTALAGLAPFMLPLLAACSAPLAAPGVGGAGSDSLERDAAEGTSSAALVVVERTITADETTHGSAVARFIRMRAGSVDDQTLRMVGATLDLPALGACAPAGDLSLDSASSSAASAVSEGPRAVELLDVGALTVEANGVRSALEARALPDIVDLVTGVLYSTPTTSARSAATEAPSDAPAHAITGQAAAAGASYVVRASGSSRGGDLDHGVAAFLISATAPGEPTELRVDGQDARLADGLALTAGEHVDLTWDVTDDRDPDDVVYVELVPSDAVGSIEAGESAANVRCLFADRGVASIPASAFVSGHGGETTQVEMSHGMIVVHRVHREAFQVGGIDSGVIRFDFARAAEFTRR